MYAITCVWRIIIYSTNKSKTQRPMNEGDGQEVPDRMEDAWRRGTRWCCSSSPSATSPWILPPIDVLEAFSTKFGAEVRTQFWATWATHEGGGDDSSSINDNTNQISNKKG
jgi:hypothetical protein